MRADFRFLASLSPSLALMLQWMVVEEYTLTQIVRSLGISRTVASQWVHATREIMAADAVR